MSLFKKLFKKDTDLKPMKGFELLKVSSIKKITSDSVSVSFYIPEELKSKFNFEPGQYVTISVDIEGKEERRSYSICSGPDENLTIGIKKVENGKVSTWVNTILKEGDNVLVSYPEGSFKWKTSDRFVVSFASGSGITPILSIAKFLEKEIGEMRLVYGNRSLKSAMFIDEIKGFKNTKTTHFLTQEQNESSIYGRITKESVSDFIKQDLNLLKADAYFLCGPEEMIMNVLETLTTFGVSKNKIHYELFTTPVLMKPVSKNEPKEIYKGTSKVTVVLDDEQIELEMKNNSTSILESLNMEGYDPPYSCKGGVCCSCKAKVMEGEVEMKLNYSLTDEEVAKGYVLTCQAFPNSEKVVISYDA